MQISMQLSFDIEDPEQFLNEVAAEYETTVKELSQEEITEYISQEMKFGGIKNHMKHMKMNGVDTDGWCGNNYDISELIQYRDENIENKGDKEA